MDSPTNEEVERIHKLYCDALTELFDRYKTKYGVSEGTKLIIE
ncbi:hypothetical protein OESDEN_22546 [Oesophagostomum dentatum]|uniref:Uncharacterized protein n=1 Tax=Oesophagostomum dentatum TaxID=61180 RepID=A0A0B1RYR7_OESDE|nr:hypothetical protein OESDEN_22546 [Oesophagostomum dentatum]